MKYLVKPFKYLIGILYIIFKILVFCMCILILLLWDLNFSNFKECYNEFFEVFYIEKCFDFERYRYDTLKDFVNSNKNYDFKGYGTD